MNITTNNITLNISVPLTLEPAYRYLSPGEIIQEGDQYRTAIGWVYSRNVGRPVSSGLGDYRRPYRRPIPATLTLDVSPAFGDKRSRPLRYKRLKLSGRYWTGITFPIPEPVIPTLKLEAGEGYRFLESNERVQEGDEYRSTPLHDWIPARGTGVRAGVWHSNFRRKIEPEYRILEMGETIREGDEYLRGDGVWRPTYIAGVQLEVGTFRRKIVSDPLSEVLKTLKEISADSSQSSKKIEALITKLES